MQPIRYRTFVRRPSFIGNFYSPARLAGHDKLRSEVAQFVNEEIGKGSLVSISERDMGETGLTITVWYRGEADEA